MEIGRRKKASTTFAAERSVLDSKRDRAAYFHAALEGPPARGVSTTTLTGLRPKSLPPPLLPRCPTSPRIVQGNPASILDATRTMQSRGQRVLSHSTRHCPGAACLRCRTLPSRQMLPFARSPLNPASHRAACTRNIILAPPTRRPNAKGAAAWPDHRTALPSVGARGLGRASWGPSS